MNNKDFNDLDYTDIFIIGGGINGVGIARDAAGRGLSVRLAEQNDLANATSSASTKLFHGGLRYLEHYEFRLVREALIEREVLLNAMPHISWPMRFLLPLHKDMRPAWLLRLGLFIYDHLGGRKILPPTRAVKLAGTAYGQPLKKHLQRAFEYSDCWVDDARLVVLNARDAHEHGADILTQTEVRKAIRTENGWAISVFDKAAATEITYYAKVLINAAGPWVGNIINNVAETNSREGVRLVRGSHIVVKKLYDHDRCYFFQNNDGRIAFAIPYEDDFTLLGTTDVDHSAANDAATCSDEEVEYICQLAETYFDKPITRDDIVWRYSGVRPLYDDKSENAASATRDYVLLVDDQDDLPLLNIFGGKITTYRRLAESAIETIAPYFADNKTVKNKWTASASLAGGNFKVDEKASLIAQLVKDYDFLDDKEAARLIKLYGTEARKWLGQAKTRADLGYDFGHQLSEAEVRHLMHYEFARCTEDILWRRTKLGLHFNEHQTQALDNWLVEHR